MLLLLLANFLLAQNPATPDCSWMMEVCEGPLPTGALNDPACTDGNSSCSPRYYYFYLNRIGNTGSGTTWTYDFKQFNFSGQLDVTPTGFGGTTKALSVLNQAESELCSPGDINQPSDPESPVFSVDADGNFAYEVANNATEGDISWTFTGRRLLFVLAIDIFPGELVIPTSFSWSFVLPDGSVCNNTNFVFPCNQMIGLSAKTVPIPDECTSPFQLRFGVPADDPIPGYPMRKKVPVFVSSNEPTDFSIEALDFLLKIEAVQPMAGISIVSGLLPSGDVLLYKEPPLNSSKKQRIYVKTENLMFSTTNTSTAVPGNTLFYILMDGPELESDCGTIELSFTDYRRMLDENSCCQPHIGGSPTTVEWGGTPCPGGCAKATLSVVEATNGLPPIVSCEDLLLDVFISTVPSVSYDEATISLNIQHSGSLVWNAALSSSLYCSLMPACVTATAVALDVLRVDFTIDGASSIVLGIGSTNHLVRLAFKGVDACIESVVFFDALLHQEGAANNCLPLTTSAIIAGTNADDLCSKSLEMKYTMFSGAPMDNVEYYVSATPNCTKGGIGTGIGTVSICPCVLPGYEQILQPIKDDNPLNGVTTYDLVLISKHIIGIEPLGSPYRMIAADANKSNSITSFDIVEIRKLILGVYQKIPGNTSYRFVEKFYVFPNPLNPFSAMFPEVSTFTIPPTTVVREFYGIKIGDVNETVIAADPTASRQARKMAYGVCGGLKGAIVEVPVFAQEDLEMVSWQTSLRYNTREARLLDLRWASAAAEFQAQAWHEPSPGVVNALWYDGTGTTRHTPTGTPLFYLKMELLADVAHVAIGLSDTEQNLLYSGDGIAAGLSLEAAALAECRQAETLATAVSLEPSWTAAIYPNPSSGQYRFDITMPIAGTGTIMIFDLLGRERWQSVVPLSAGYNSISADQAPVLDSGQYFVRIETPLGRKMLRFVKHH